MADFREVIKGKAKVDTAAYPPFFIFEETGDWVAGVLSEPRVIDTEFGRMKVMTLTQENGEKVSISLSSQLLGLWGWEGKAVVIKYNGRVKNTSGKGYTKQFEVYG